MAHPELVDHEIVLFSGRLGTQTVRVWLEPNGSGVSLLSHDIGPALEASFGAEDIETFLTIRGENLPRLADLLGCAATVDGVTRALCDRFAGDSAATSHLRSLLDDSGISYEFHLV